MSAVDIPVICVCDRFETFTAANAGGTGVSIWVVVRLAICADENLFKSPAASELICVDVRPGICVPVSHAWTSVELNWEICEVARAPIWVEVRLSACVVVKAATAVVFRPWICAVDRFWIFSAWKAADPA